MPQMTIQLLRTSGWVPKATNTNPEYVDTACPQQQWLKERASVLRYMYNVYLVYFSLLS